MSLVKEENDLADPEVAVSATLASPPLKRDKRPWTAEEDEALMLAVLDIKQRKGFDENEEDDEDWEEIAESVPDRSAFQCYQRYVRCLHKPTSSSSQSENLTAEMNHAAKKEEKIIPKIGSTRSKSGSLKDDDEEYEDLPDPGKRKRGSSEGKKSSPKDASSSKKKAVPPADAASKDASPSKWTAEETQLLKKLVEQYQDSKWIS